MEPYPVAAATFALVTHWAVGLAISVALADREVGLIRDHPQFGRRLSSLVVPVMAAAGLAVPTLLALRVGAHPPVWLLIAVVLMLPFAWVSWRWSRTWIGRHPALKRRRLGVYTAVAGLMGVVPTCFLAVSQFEPEWRSVIPMTIFAGGVGLPGSLTNFSLMALTAGLPQEVPGGKMQGVAELAGFGLLSNVLALLDVGFAGTGSAWPVAASRLSLGWALLGVALPGAILLVRAKWRTMPDAIFMPGALLLALVGQWMAYLLIFQYPGLVPPIMWE